MANSLTIEKQSVFGDFRVIIGNLSVADGDAGLPVGTGLSYIYWAGTTSSAMTRTTINGTTNGNILVTTAASGATYPVIIFGR